MLNLGCIWEGDEFGPSAPLILHDMVLRNLPEGTKGSFTVFTDKPDDLGPHIIKRPLSDPWRGVIMFPLNCVVVRSLDAMLKGEKVQSCFYDGSFPEEAAIVHFLDKRPSECEGWVQHVYKIGGSTVLTQDFIPNVPKDQLTANIRAAIKRDCRWFSPKPAHDETALIVGGGPSLKDNLFALRLMAQECPIFALNGVPAYLEAQGITADNHVMLDADLGCLKFVAPHLPMIRYYASQSPPEVLDAAGSSLVCWHGGGEAMTDIKDYVFKHVVGGGSTGASRALILAYGLGYRKFHLFGMDSSFQDGKQHAYAQGEYSKTVTVTCFDETFQTSTQLLGQAEDFKMIFPDLLQADCEITVHGDGLLQAIAIQMAA